MPISAKDKAVIVTGGAGEMGSSIARRLVDEGAKVVIADVADGSALADELSRTGEAVYVRTDVTSEESTEAMAQAALDAFGRIDALVNNAGLFTAKPWDELTLADWRERFAVNVEGTFLAAKAVVPAMTEQGRGKIINIGSDTVWMGTPGFAHYVASKGAVLAFTRAIATELGPRGITSVYVTPTLLETPGTRAAFPQGHFDFVLSHTPIGRFEKPEDVNGLIIFLVSDDAAFINGAAINIGGGISMH
ncbi:MAG TPA: SDR family NAD(P)-dependent oxidoreductase [Thermomicrobiales bacterium]|jgi:NAD(P)-dependent dehydrogenase (short-subunit alcohol dehydrogenase family)|nr:SDR family NAD(P)-dependent oxidoreductase [Thermomicrobiales bacterium]